MGQQLIGRPVSQRTSFSTLSTPSSASNMLTRAQMLGLGGPQLPPQSGLPGQLQLPGSAQSGGSQMVSAGQFQYPMTTIGGFQGFGGMPRWGGLPGKQMQSG